MAKKATNMKSMVSIRIPKSLVAELKKISDTQHFLDVSEAVRSIVRNKWLQHKDPIAFQIAALRKEISSNLKERENDNLIQALEQIRDSIKNEK
jgi:Arc/MetJ-type ribon-helix-helix transcriptional regulator